MSDDYDVLPLPVKLGSIRDKESQIIKPFVGVYFPVSLLEKMKWTKETRLTLMVEKDCVKIYAADPDREPFIYDLNELIYELKRRNNDGATQQFNGRDGAGTHKLSNN